MNPWIKIFMIMIMIFINFNLVDSPDLFPEVGTTVQRSSSDSSVADTTALSQRKPLGESSLSSSPVINLDAQEKLRSDSTTAQEEMSMPNESGNSTLKESISKPNKPLPLPPPSDTPKPAAIGDSKMVASDQEKDDSADDMSVKVSRSGFLYKKRNMYRKWQSRWFVLENRTLFIYKSPEEVGENSILGLFDLVGACAETSDVKPFCFRIQLANNTRTIILEASSDDDCKGWYTFFFFFFV